MMIAPPGIRRCNGPVWNHDQAVSNGGRATRVLASGLYALGTALAMLLSSIVPARAPSQANDTLKLMRNQIAIYKMVAESTSLRADATA